MGDEGHIDWTCEHCSARRFTCARCGTISIVDDDTESELCVNCFRKPSPPPLLDAHRECVEALKALIAHTKAWERLTAEEAGHEPCLSDPLVDAIAAIAKLEKANG